jgi:hypothetical protein
LFRAWRTTTRGLVIVSAMIRRDDDGDAVQSNQQPWRQGHPDWHVPRSKSIADPELVGNGPIAPIKQQRQLSLSVKSDTAYISPAKCKKHFTSLSLNDQGKSPISVIDAESEPTQKESAQVQRDAAEESTSKSRCLESLNDDELDLNVIETAEWGQEDFESSYLIDFGSIPRSFRLSSSNFSARSDLTGPTLFEPPDESNYRASPRRQPDSRRSLAPSPDAAPLRPQRQMSKFDLTASMECDGEPSLVGGRQVDHIPTKPARQSSRRLLSRSGRETTHSVVMNSSQKSNDSSPCKPMRQKSVSALLKNKATEQTKSLHCQSIDSSPPAKPQRKQSSRSLGSSLSSIGDSIPGQRLHQSINFHESILEEASSSDFGAADA